MERKGSTSSGIRVDREIVVYTDYNSNGEQPASHPPSVVSVVRSLSDIRREQRSPEPLRSDVSDTPLRLNSIVRHTDVQEARLEDLLEEQRNQDNLRYLIEFLQETPPPGNYMSRPDSSSTSLSEQGNIWTKLKAFRKNRETSKKHRPPVIRLPDSAVAAKTIGGHQHIAISIPFEHCHLGPISPTQYPVFDSIEREFTREIETRLGPMRTYNPERGVVTVLKPVAEDPESCSSGAERSPLSPKSLRLSSASQGLPVPFPTISPSGGRRSPSGRAARTTTASATTQESKPMKTSEFEAVTSPQGDGFSYVLTEKQPSSLSPMLPRPEPIASRAAARSHTRNASVASNAPSVQSTKSAMRPNLPARRSSRNSSMAPGSKDSIDGVLSRSGSARKSQKDLIRRSLTESIFTSGLEPTLLDAKAIPTYVRPHSRQQVDSPLDPNFPQPSTTSRSVQTDIPSIHPTLDKIKKRRDRLREKKKRDIGAMKMPRDSSQPSASHLLQPPTAKISPESPVLGNFSDSLDSHPSKSSKTSSSTKKKRKPPPINVVAHINLAMSEMPEIPEISPGAVPKTSRHSAKNLSEKVSPLSPSRYSDLSFDRTSYKRRKERQAERKSHHAAQAAMAEDQETAERLSREELLARYLALKEIRIHDMEKQLRRIERNSEVWLRSLVPLVEALTETILQEREHHTYHQRHVDSSTRSSAPHSHRDGRKNHLLRPSRSYESLFDLSAIHRQHTDGGEARAKKRRPVSLMVSGSQQHYSGGQLYKEFERGFQKLRATGERDGDLDARKRETEQRYSRDSDSPDSYFSAEMSTRNCKSSISSSSSKATGFETLEPLMRELQGVARVRLELR
ncbi:uncharacterized protein BCR38DRAFT_487630 [Pseudomassariella vexata]|uniref:Uncharacterized protein n=1 Tax=Pseudomassariella vexata TaxID=1141098 RepID=A0A1Y2DN23_9PEZI|nr:uncharacterized protein BCR38DRAFT_487630 [Pseudomassariella vexata]ORY60569.1 hypothetical protein BCR38DRAFT_487630 [Pseudomassariella vexata]